MRTRINIFAFFLAFTFLLTAHAQVAPASGAVAIPPFPANDFDPLLDRLQQTAQAMSVDLSRLRIDKWKADSALKRQMQRDADSISANVRSALPEIIGQVRARPQDLAPAFKLYRNLNVLSDVFSNLSLAAGNFAPGSEAAALSGDAVALGREMRALGDKVEALAAMKDGELAQLQARFAQATAVPARPKKIVIDDEAPKKHAPKRKKAPSKAATTEPNSAKP